MTEYAPGKRPTIKGLIPGLTEIGKIKIGRKGEERPTRDGKGTWQLPEKLDYFIITSLERGKDNNLLRDDAIYARLKFTDKPKEIPIVLLFDSLELNFQSRYVCYVGKALACSGDGEKAITADRKIIDCPCPKKEPTYKGPDKCKMHGCLSCMIRGAGSVGGVWKFRTTGYNSTVGIHSSLALISTLTGGMLAGIPLKMCIGPKAATNPDDGKALTIQVVRVIFDGDIDTLQQQTLRIVQRDATFRQRLLTVEETVAKSMSVDAEIVDQAGDITEEFNPVEPETVAAVLETPPAPAVSAPTLTVIPDAPCDVPAAATSPTVTPTAPPAPMPTIEMPDLFK